MLNSTAITREIPRLRRYARALTGNQESGDAYIDAALEALVNDPSPLQGPGGPAIGLFQTFTRLWNSVPINARPGPGSPAPDRHLTRISPLPRQAFLLITLEEFSENDTAAILGVDPDKVRNLIEESGRELAAEIATEVLIIEDEPLIAIDLETLVEGLGHSVTGIARTHKEAVDLVRIQRPGLILADIRLADGSSGLEAVNEMLRSFEVPVVFITAYPEQLLTGERPEPAFLISKPFRPATVGAVISQALFFERKARVKGSALGA
jgi:CheY-like chemotaxis protein